MKIKFSIWILVIGYAFDFIGGWMKITHQAPADLTLTMAVLKVIGLILLAIFFLSHPKVREFLQSIY